MATLQQSSFHRRARRWLVLAIWFAGCAIASPPIKSVPQVVATPLAGQLTISAQSGPVVGDVQPVYVSVANGTDEPRSVVPSQIFALNESGERIAPLAPPEAARQAGGVGELKGALASAAVSGVGGGALGAGLGALAGAGSGGAGPGALLGAAIGAGSGVFSGATRGQDRADQQANQQIDGVALQPEEVMRNFTVSGYVFFPKGHYREIEMVIVNRETGDTQSIRQPWR